MRRDNESTSKSQKHSVIRLFFYPLLITVGAAHLSATHAEAQDQPAPRPTPTVMIMTGTNGGPTYNFSDEDVNGSLPRGSSILRQTLPGVNDCVARRLEYRPITARDGLRRNRDRSIPESARDSRGLQVGTPEYFRAHFKATLQCMDECISDSDADFLVQCHDVDAIIAQTRAGSPPDFSQSANRCTNERIRQGMIDGLYRGSHTGNPATINGRRNCVDRVRENTFPAFSGVDVAFLIDNSGSMEAFGREVVQEVFPILMQRASQLRAGARVLTLTQNLDPRLFRIFTNVSSREFLTSALQLVGTAQSPGTYFAPGVLRDDNERPFMALNMAFRRFVRPAADLAIFVLTDEHDHSNQSGLDFIRGTRALTAGDVKFVATRRPGDMDQNLDEAASLTDGAYLDLSMSAVRDQLIQFLDEYIRPTRPRQIHLNQRVSDLLKVSLNGQALDPRNYRLENSPYEETPILSLDPTVLRPGEENRIQVLFIPPGMELPQQGSFPTLDSSNANLRNILERVEENHPEVLNPRDQETLEQTADRRRRESEELRRRNPQNPIPTPQPALSQDEYEAQMRREADEARRRIDQRLGRPSQSVTVNNPPVPVVVNPPTTPAPAVQPPQRPRNQPNRGRVAPSAGRSQNRRPPQPQRPSAPSGTSQNAPLDDLMRGGNDPLDGIGGD